MGHDTISDKIGEKIDGRLKVVAWQRRAEVLSHPKRPCLAAYHILIKRPHMPELPELHIFARNLDRRLSGRVVTDVMCVKEFLVDQKVLRGIGNAYSGEILWAGRIAPQSLCGRLPEAAVQALHQAIRSVLQDAIAQLERIAPDAISGEWRDFLAIHYPDRTHSPTGSPIRCTTIGFRKTYFCDEQVLYVGTSFECNSALD